MNYRFYGWQTADVAPVASKNAKEFAGINNPREMYEALCAVWCEYTCAPRLRENWSVKKRTVGQCSITAFLVQDIFGGKVYGIPRKGGNYHCYNVIPRADGSECIFDLTSEQFGDEELCYENNPEQFREVHFMKQEKKERYEFLKKELKRLCAAGIFINHKMRRKDREITDFDTIIQMIDSCHVVRLGFYDRNEPDFPYITPMNFAYTVTDGIIRLYVHGARAGRRWELLQNTNLCSVQMEKDDGMELIPEYRDITERYRSVMAKAKIRLLEGDELVRGIELCVARDEMCRGFEWNHEALKHVAVWELELYSITAKWNRIKGNAD
ncbi:MAG: pyridoxamine 5'-phosphate oxidase family protein [Treponema sp.]|nr:pyridoxamine 5'-phosphate oxidase family protein [Treponema sp.]